MALASRQLKINVIGTMGGEGVRGRAESSDCSMSGGLHPFAWESLICAGALT